MPIRLGSLSTKDYEKVYRGIRMKKRGSNGNPQQLNRDTMHSDVWGLRSKKDVTSLPTHGPQLDMLWKLYGRFQMRQHPCECFKTITRFKFGAQPFVRKASINSEPSQTSAIVSQQNCHSVFPNGELQSSAIDLASASEIMIDVLRTTWIFSIMWTVKVA